MHYDWLVVGAGLSGATFAERLAADANQRVLVVDRRPHVAGNVFDSPDHTGLLIHRYGPHIFHTRSEQVWAYLNRFTKWHPYVHRVQAEINNTMVPLPFNLNSIERLFDTNEAARLCATLLREFPEGTKVPVLRLLEHSDRALADLGEFVYQNVFLHYTVKQWGYRPEELDRSVTGRVPVLVGRDNRYFQDPHQGTPLHGYTAMVQRMLEHPSITVATETDQSALGSNVTWDRCVFTGPIDEYFGMEYGALPYRSLRFEHRTLQVDRAQPVAQVNYPDQRPYTRSVEHAHFSDAHLGVTTVTREFPMAHIPGETEPYYPVPTEESHQAYRRYAEHAQKFAPDTLFVGRLAHYRYYDMDQAVNHALHAYQRHVRDGAPQLLSTVTG